MSDYRRLISYIYAYEGGIKGKNIGFAKLEARRGQCKIQVSVRNVYMGNQDEGVFLLAGDREILIGKIFLRGGAGEFRTSVAYGDVAGSGVSLEQCYGLTVHSMDDTWYSYTTIWEDAVAHAAAVDLEDVTAEEAERRETARIPGSEIYEKTLREMDFAKKTSVVDSIEAEIMGRKKPEPRPEPPRAMRAEAAARPMRSELPAQLEAPRREMPEIPVQPELPGRETPEMPAQPEAPMREMPEMPAQPEAPRREMPEMPAQPEPPRREMPEMPAQPESPRREMPEMPAQPEAPRREMPEMPAQPEAPRQETSEMPEPPRAPQPEEPLFDSQQSDRLMQFEQDEQAEKEDVEKLWLHFQRHYPKIQAFDYQGGCETLLIKPQDIGLLPRETWNYGNNSFLLHGYYNHRYLILARLVGQKGEVRFLLGVPGHYYSNEKYMASMFGFPNFVLSKMQPAGDGRFGYWYTDIRLAT